MKRWFISRIVTDADGNQGVKVSQYEVPYSVVIATKQWGCGKLAVQDPSLFNGDADVFILPDATLDAAWSSLPSNVRNAVTNRLGQAGFLTSGIQNSMTIRQVLNHIGQQIDANFSANKIDIRDPWA
jgi:hypothetical protein